MSGSIHLADMIRPRDNSFGVVRLAMALAVLVSHSYLFLGLQEPLERWTGHSLGEHAVQVFFILSGIVVTESYRRGRGLADFAVARALRIFPALVVCVLLTATLIGPLMTTRTLAEYAGDPGVVRYVMKTLLLITGAAPLPGVFETLPAPGLVNMSLWTLKFEVMC